LANVPEELQDLDEAANAILAGLSKEELMQFMKPAYALFGTEDDEDEDDDDDDRSPTLDQLDIDLPLDEADEDEDDDDLKFDDVERSDEYERRYDHEEEREEEDRDEYDNYDDDHDDHDYENDENDDENDDDENDDENDDEDDDDDGRNEDDDDDEDYDSLMAEMEEPDQLEDVKFRPLFEDHEEGEDGENEKLRKLEAELLGGELLDGEEANEEEEDVDEVVEEDEENEDEENEDEDMGEILDENFFNSVDEADLEEENQKNWPEATPEEEQFLRAELAELADLEKQLEAISSKGVVAGDEKTETLPAATTENGENMEASEDKELEEEYEDEIETIREYEKKVEEIEREMDTLNHDGDERDPDVLTQKEAEELFYFAPFVPPAGDVGPKDFDFVEPPPKPGEVGGYDDFAFRDLVKNLEEGLDLSQLEANPPTEEIKDESEFLRVLAEVMAEDSALTLDPELYTFDPKETQQSDPVIDFFTNEWPVDDEDEDLHPFDVAKMAHEWQTEMATVYSPGGAKDVPQFRDPWKLLQRKRQELYQKHWQRVQRGITSDEQIKEADIKLGEEAKKFEVFLLC
jgi:hypothetical protein